MINPFDILIAIAMIVGVAIGFVRGLLRMLFAVVVIYLATVVAMTFYVPFGRFIGRILTTMSRTGTEALAFALILILVAVILQFLLSRTYRDTEWPGLRQIDQLGGLIFGFLVTSLWIGLAIVGAGFVLQTPAPGGEATQSNLTYYFQTSTLIPIFYRFLPLAFATLKPWVPKGKLPDIFSLRPL
jgi:membrane protein required for colicin V production